MFKVVDNISSELGLGLPIESVESINADHRQMVRCSRREDEVYRKIAGELRSRLEDGVLMAPQSVFANIQQVVPGQ